MSAVMMIAGPLAALLLAAAGLLAILGFGHAASRAASYAVVVAVLPLVLAQLWCIAAGVDVPTPGGFGSLGTVVVMLVVGIGVGVWVSRRRAKPPHEHPTLKKRVE